MVKRLEIVANITEYVGLETLILVDAANVGKCWGRLVFGAAMRTFAQLPPVGNSKNTVFQNRDKGRTTKTFLISNFAKCFGLMLQRDV